MLKFWIFIWIVINMGGMGGMGGGMGGGDGAAKINMTGPVKVISPIQMPGIVSPSIYIQNT